MRICRIGLFFPFLFKKVLESADRGARFFFGGAGQSRHFSIKDRDYTGEFLEAIRFKLPHEIIDPAWIGGRP